MLIRSTITAMVLLYALPLRAAEVLVRIAATVNGHVILQSDWDDEVRYESFMSGRQLSQVTDEARKAALDRRLDQELLREQVSAAEVPHASPEEVEKQLQALKDDYLREHGSPLGDALSKYQLTESNVRSHIETELDQLRIVDARLRPSVQIDPAEVESYYKDKVLPELARSGGKKPTLQEASSQIRELLIQEKMNQMLVSWIETLRSQAQIRRFPAASEARGSRSKGPGQ